MVQFRSEYIFAFDLVSSVMHSYFSDWHPISLVTRSPTDSSSFTTNIRRFVQLALDGRLGNQASILFDYWFKRKLINLKNCEDFTKHLTIEFCIQGYDPLEFLEICVLIAEFSALSYIYGVVGAPHFGIFCITHIVRYFKNNGQFSESTWLDLDAFAQSMLAT